MDDMVTIVLVTTAVCVATALLGALVLRLVRGRSLGWSIVVAALIPLVAVTASVALNVQLMFISAHDSSAVSVALACATLIGALLSFGLGRRVAQESRRLTTALRDLGAPRDGRDPEALVGLDGASGEIAALGGELEATRERLALAQQRAHALEDSRRELVAFLSHDLRTPLSGLRALAEGLEDDVVEDRPAALRQMRQTVDRMTGLVGDLFELSRLHAPATNGSSSTRSMVSLAELAQDVTSELDAHAKRRNVRLCLNSSGANDRLAVRGNSDELARAFTNLVSNAVRHTPAGGTVLVVTDRLEDGRIEVAVTDGCGGIADGDLPRLFDVGWRATPERGTRDDAGAGLGLAIAKGVIEAHAGSIAVENVGGGCRFGVLLPAESGTSRAS